MFDALERRYLEALLLPVCTPGDPPVTLESFVFAVPYGPAGPTVPLFHAAPSAAAGHASPAAAREPIGDAWIRYCAAYYLYGRLTQQAEPATS